MANNKRRARRDSYLSKRRAKNKRFLRIMAVLVLVSGLGFFYLNSSMNKENEKMSQDIVSSQKKLKDIKTEISELKEDYEMRNTDLFKEKVARERLGMVKKDEEAFESEENSVIKQVSKPNEEGLEGENKAESALDSNSNENLNQASSLNEEVNTNANSNQNLSPEENSETNADGR